MDGIIFDVDGTLWDSTEVVAAAYNLTFQEYANLPIRVTAGDLKALFGRPMDVIMNLLLPGLPREEQERIGAICFQKEHEALEITPGRLYPGTGDTLKRLAQTYPLFIVSNCQCGYIELFLRKTGLGPCIQSHLCFGQTHTSKGQTILRLMREQGLRSPVYVGDTQGDADACAEAGIPFVFAEYGFGDARCPDYRIRSIAELTALFAGS